MILSKSDQSSSLQEQRESGCGSQWTEQPEHKFVHDTSIERDYCQEQVATDEILEQSIELLQRWEEACIKKARRQKNREQKAKGREQQEGHREQEVRDRVWLVRKSKEDEQEARTRTKHQQEKLSRKSNVREREQERHEQNKRYREERELKPHTWRLIFEWAKYKRRGLRWKKEASGRITSSTPPSPSSSSTAGKASGGITLSTPPSPSSSNTAGERSGRITSSTPPSPSSSSTAGERSGGITSSIPPSPSSSSTAGKACGRITRPIPQPPPSAKLEGLQHEIDSVHRLLSALLKAHSQMNQDDHALEQILEGVERTRKKVEDTFALGWEIKPNSKQLIEQELEERQVLKAITPPIPQPPPSAILEKLQHQTDSMHRRLSASKALSQMNEDDHALEQILERIERAWMEVKYTLAFGWEIRPNSEQLIEQELEERQVLKAIKREIDCNCPHRTPTITPTGEVPLCCRRKQIFEGMLRQVRENQEYRTYLELRKSVLEDKLSTTFSRISWLSSWTPSSSHNRKLRELLRDALMALNDLGGDEYYRDCLRDFMKRHHALCAFTLDHAMDITTGDSRQTAELCKSLRQLAQNLGAIASQKADQYQRLYEEFIANREHLSDWLDLASAGRGRFIVDSFTSSLKDMASDMRREADFWNSQWKLFHVWPNIRQTYSAAMDDMPTFPSEKLHKECSGVSTPPVRNSLTKNAAPTEHSPQRLSEDARKVSTSFALVQNLQPNTTQSFLVKTEGSIAKRMSETRGYLEFTIDMAEKQISQRAQEDIKKTTVRLARKALHIGKLWSNLYRKNPPSFDVCLDMSSSDYHDRITVTIDIASKKLHPYLIEYELCLRDMKQHFLSLGDFWARTNSDPATFTSWLRESRTED